MSYGRLECVVFGFRAMQRNILVLLWKAFGLLIGLFYFLIFMLLVMIFFIALHDLLLRKEYLYLGGLCFPVLAVLYGFTSLLYNRSRAFPSGAVQRRSLYAAERGLQATLLFVLGLAIGVVTITLVETFELEAVRPSHPSYEILIGGLKYTFLASSFPRFEMTVYLFTVFPVLMSFGAFFIAIKSVSHGTVKYLTLRMLMKRVRKK